MSTYLPLLLGLLCVFNLCQSEDVVLGSGSDLDLETPDQEGSGSVFGGQPNSNSAILDGSGSDLETTTAVSNRISNTFMLPDDEDEPMESGSGQTSVHSSMNGDNDDNDIVTGSGMPETTTPDMSPFNIRCMEYYCWCLDRSKEQLPDSMKYFPRGTAEETKANILQVMRCADRLTTTVMMPPSRSPSTEAAPDNDRDIVMVDTAKQTTPLVEFVKPKTTGTTRAPYVVGGDDLTPKQDKPAVAEEPDRGPSGTKGLFGDDDDGILEEPAPPESALFDHPGILAAIIGGGVVALLSALLLIMFIVYRMRKKDEGSYPLDPDSKPPRLHTYTRAPNKEFYA